MRLPREIIGPPQIAPPTPLSQLRRFLTAQVLRFAGFLCAQMSRRGIRQAVAVILAGVAAQALWLYLVPFYWGHDSIANLAIGRMYFGLPYETWSIKNYYPPGYPIFLTLMGVHHLDTLRFLRFGLLFVGGLMPLLLFMMLRPFNGTAAFVAALVFAANFGNALYSTDIMNHHFHAFLLLLMSVAVARYLLKPGSLAAVVLGCAAALANTGREVTLFIFAATVCVLFVATSIERRNVVTAARSAAIMIASYLALTGAFSVGRQAALGEPYRFGLTDDIAARTLFQGTYYGASIYQKEFRPGEDFVFVKPENGPASREFFETIRNYFAIADLKILGLQDFNGIDEVLRNVIAEPNVRNTYIFWMAFDTLSVPAKADRLWRDVAIEAAIAQPRIVRYYIWNFWTYLFGLPTLNEGSCVKCVCPPCFGTTLPQSIHQGPFMGAEFFSRVAGPRVIAEMAKEHDRATMTARYASYLYAGASQLFTLKPALILLLLASVFLADGKTRYLMIYCVAVVLIIGGTTSLAWPVQGRYQYPAIPFVLAGAAVSVAELLRRLMGFWQMRATREPAR